ncbi:MAG: sulfatase-like hydrolase/transferase [Myxococcota bacterium]
MRHVRRFAPLLALWAATACGAPPAPAPGPPDVLLVVLDTVRADRLSTYGHTRPTAPRLDALAGLGVVFDDVTAAAPWTWPSHASIFTGEPPHVHGAHLAGGADASVHFGMGVSPLRPEVTTLAERFAAGGYRTEALVVNHWLHPSLGLLRGFERAHHFDRDAALFEAARRTTGRRDERPLFLFVNVMTAHSPFRDGPGDWGLADRAFLDPERAPAWVRPYLTPDLPRGVHLSQVDDSGRPSGVIRHSTGDLVIPPEDLEKLLALYDASVAGADFVLGRLLDTWIDAGRDGVVAVTSDHGEGFGEHGLLDHRATVYPEVLAVPLVIAAPGLPSGTRVATPVSLVSLHDTLLDLAGLDHGGRSLVPLARGDAPPDPPVLAARASADPFWASHAGEHFAQDWHLLRAGDWALVHGSHPDTPPELYDLRRDPRMTTDVSRTHPERTARLLAEARARSGAGADAAGPDRAPAAVLDIPAEVAQGLRDLGYAAPPAAPAP